MTEENDLKDVIREDQQRGRRRRPYDSKETKRRKEILAGLRRAFAAKDEREFLRLLREIGVSEEHPKFSEYLKFFRREV
jgi:hypothetical protein